MARKKSEPPRPIIPKGKPKQEPKTRKDQQAQRDDDERKAAGVRASNIHPGQQ